MSISRFLSQFKPLIVLPLLLLVGQVQAQDAGTIITDRPDLTESAFSVEKGQIQFEVGFLRESFISIISSQVPNYLIRYGLGNDLELRIAGAVENLEFMAFDSKPIASPIEIGFKYELMQESESGFQLAVISHFYHTALGGGNLPDNYGTITRLTLSHALSETFDVGYNLGVAAESGSDADIFYTIAVGLPLAEKLGLYAELFGNNVGNSGSHAFDAGLTYLVTPTVQLDSSAGTGLFGEESSSFLSVGISALF